MKPKLHANQQPTIPARHHWLGDALVYWGLVRWAIWSHFDRVWLKIEGTLPDPAQGPLIGYLNHPSWWDGYMALLLNRIVLRDQFQGFLMMEERELHRFPFFAWSGAFAVHRQDARSALRSVAYISHLLHERRARALYIFPQGTITPNDQRPLTLFPGIAHIVQRVGGATLWPIALRYEFRGRQRPEAFIRVGPAHDATDSDARTLTNIVTQHLTVACDALRDEFTTAQLGDYQVLLHGRAGTDQVFRALWRRT